MVLRKQYFLYIWDILCQLIHLCACVFLNDIWLGIQAFRIYNTVSSLAEYQKARVVKKNRPERKNFLLRAQKSISF